MSMEEEQEITPFPEHLKSSDSAADKPTTEQTEKAPESEASGLKEPSGDPPNIPYDPRDNVQQILKVFESKALKPGQFAVYERLSVLGVNSTEANALSSHYPEVDMGDSEGERLWTETTVEGSKHAVQYGTFEDALQRAGSLWTNSVKADGQRLNIGRPKFEKGDGMKLSGQQAVMRIQSLTGLGTHVRVPLWHTGIWITMRAPTESALLELERRLGHEKVRFGRDTAGLMFSNTMVYLMNTLVDFALQHVIEASVAHVQIEDLKEIILLPDALSMIHGLLCTMYPNGYPYRQPCVINPFKCTHVHEATISLQRLMWTDELRLTESQSRHMTRKLSKFTEVELKRYQEQHTYLASREVQLTENVSMLLHTPTIEEYRQIGTSWVDSLVAKVNRSFANVEDEEMRADLIAEQGRVTSLCQYAHYVEKLILLEEGQTNSIEDPQTIVDVLGTLTSSMEVFENYHRGVGKFIETTILSVAAVPKVPCPKCSSDKGNSEAYEAQPYLIPLDIVNVFFTLRARRLTKILRMG